MRKFDAGVARAEMRILADMLKRAERASDYENGHYDDNRARYDELKRQLEKHNKRVIDYLNMWKGNIAIANITYTYEYVWYKSRYYPDTPFRMRKCYLPDSSYIKVKDESETITYTVEEAKAEAQRFRELKTDLEYKDRWNDNDYRMNSYYWRVICDLEKMIREAA